MGITKNDIISGLYLDKDIDQAIKKMEPAYLQDELRSEMFLVLCEMADDRLIDMHENGTLKFYLVRTMISMIKSNTSRFYYKFRNQVSCEIDQSHDKAEIDSDYAEEINDKLSKSIEVLHWYEAQILKLYAENGQNILALSRETKIPYRSLMKTIKKAKTLLKYKIRNYAID